MNSTLSESADLPGYDIVSSGLRDLAAKRPSVNALLVAVAAPRLRSDGLAIPANLPVRPKDRLWDLLQQESGDDAHRRYNALIGRVLSFAAAFESRRTARDRLTRAPTG